VQQAQTPKRRLSLLSHAGPGSWCGFVRPFACAVVEVDPPIIPKCQMPALLLALVAPLTVRSMAHDASASASVRAPSVLTDPVPSFRGHSSVTTSLPRLFHCFSCLPSSYPPAFHLVSCAYPPTSTAAPSYLREPHYCAPIRTLPTSHPNRRLPVSPTNPSPSQPTQTQRLLRCTAATCDPLRRLIDPPCVTCSSGASSQPLQPFIWIASLPFQKNLNNPLALVNAWGISQHHLIRHPCFTPIVIQTNSLLGSTQLALFASSIRLSSYT
jgi:hypothetical protein